MHIHFLIHVSNIEWFACFFWRTDLYLFKSILFDYVWLDPSVFCLTVNFTGWWFGIFFFHMLGIIIPTDFHIFQRGKYTTNQFTASFVWKHIMNFSPSHQLRQQHPAWGRTKLLGTGSGVFFEALIRCNWGWGIDASPVITEGKLLSERSGLICTWAKQYIYIYICIFI